MPASLLGVDLSVSSILSFALLFAVLWIWLKSAFNPTSPPTSHPRPSPSELQHLSEMLYDSSWQSRNQKKGEAGLISDFRDVTGASTADATRFIKKYKNLEQAVDAYFNAGGSSAPTQDKGRDKKLGDIWERFKDPSDPKLIKIDGTMQLCEELGIDPEADAVLFCLAADLGSKATGEWAKDPWVAGWSAMPGNIDSIEGMKSRLPALRQSLKSDPAYFKKVYLHTFELIKPAGSRVLPLETAVDMWTLFIPPALTSSPSALASKASDSATFSQADFDAWIAFQQKKGKAVSKDTWTLFVDFVRSIDPDFKEYDESGAWPSTIDDFVEHMRSSKS